MAHFLLNHPPMDPFMDLAELLNEIGCIMPNQFPNFSNIGAMLHNEKKS